MEANDQKEMLADINRVVRDDEANLSEWEDKFVDSICRRLEEGLPLTDPQDSKLEEIWKRVTGL